MRIKEIIGGKGKKKERNESCQMVDDESDKRCKRQWQGMNKVICRREYVMMKIELAEEER